MAPHAPLRIAFFGLPLAAELLRRDGHALVYAALCRRGCPGERRLVRALPPSQLQLGTKLPPRLPSQLRALGVDLVVSWYWTKKLASEVLAVAPALGVHPSLLPRHRGPDPIFWAIDSGDSVTGVTAHRLEADYDTGDVLAHEALAIAPDWSAWTLAKQLDRPSLRVLREVCAQFARERCLRGMPQCDDAATAAPALSEDELELNWSWTTARLLRRIRAASPFPGAFLHVGEDVVVVTRAREVAARPYASLQPGDVACSADGAVVRCADGVLLLEEGRVVSDDGAEDAYLGADALRDFFVGMTTPLPFGGPLAIR